MAHSYRNGRLNKKDNLKDYSFMLWGLIELHQVTLNNFYLDLAEEICSVMLVEFWDKENGGFFFTPNDNEELVIRQKSIYDDAIPSGNSLPYF